MIPTIQRSSLAMLSVFSMFLAACEKAPVKFGLSVQDSLGNQIDCESDSLNFEFSAPYYVEAGQEFRLNYGGEEAQWNIVDSQGNEQQLSGKSVNLKVDEIGSVNVSAKGANLCKGVDEANLNLEVITPLGSPNFKINGGEELTKESQVEIANQVRGATEMKLSYRSDCGNSPWLSYQKSSKAFLPGLNFKAKLYMKFRNQVRESACVEADIIHDNMGPIVQLSNLPEKLNNIRNHRFTLQASDNLSGILGNFCSLDGGEFSRCFKENPWTILEEGPHSIRFYSTDRAGNTSQIVSYSFDADFTSPEIEFVKIPTAFISKKSFEFEVNVTDNYQVTDRIQCRQEAGSYQECGKKFLMNFSNEGPQTVFVKARDLAGNWSKEKKVNFQIDSLGPEVTITQKPQNPSAEESASFRFVSVDRGVQTHKLYCRVDSNNFVECKDSFNVSSLVNGRHRFEIYGADSLGNASAIVSYDWEVDNGIVNQEFLVEEELKKIDILVVIDNSSSMDAEQKEMAKRFSTFIKNLSAFDWQLGIITTDASDKNEFSGGRLVPFVDSSNQRSGLYTINAKTPGADLLFANTIVRREGGNDTEEGIKSIRKFLDREDSTILRENSHFTTIVLSDEDENSRGTGLDDYNKPSHLVNTLRKKFEIKKSYSHHSIIYRPGDDSCGRKGGKYEGNTYAQLSKLTDGILGDICAKDYSSQLLDIGDRLKEVSLSIDLLCEPLDLDKDGMGDVIVSSYPAGQDLGFRLRGNKLLFNLYPSKGTKLNLIYHCDKKP